jgi:putative ABC transport system permease protein
MGVFAAIALALAAIGVYGVISYGVSRRTHEIGLRMALGASRWEVLGAVVGRGAVLLSCGILVGTVAGLSVTRPIAAFAYGVSSTDPLTFTVAPAVLMAVGITACLRPAIRASRIDPAVALRDE